MSQTASDLGLPGLDVASESSQDAALLIERMGANDWLTGLLLSPDVEPAVRAIAEEQFEPVAALRQIPDVAAALARVELDVCGAWVTLCCAGTPQPVGGRRAGWIDYRGQLTTLPPPALDDDRVGLGPGDSIVLLGPELSAQTDADGELFAAECLPSALLAATSSDSASDLISHVAHALKAFNGAADLGPLLVLRVPLEDKTASAERVASVTGLAPAELKRTRYPLGEQLMARRPAPPREARLVLTADLTQVSFVRDLLQRLLASWRMADGSIDDALLLASEVTANAIRHGQSPVTLIARYDGQRVRIEVGDASREMPTLRHPEPFDEGGRGVGLVASLADEWGVLPTRGGKRVWFEVALGPEPT